LATVLDNLIVLLSLDPTKFNEGQKSALEQLRKTKENASSTAKQLEASGAQAAGFFDKIAGSALKLSAILVGGIGLKEIVQQTVSGGAAMGRLAYATGTTAKELSILAQAADQRRPCGKEWISHFRADCKGGRQHARRSRDSDLQPAAHDDEPAIDAGNAAALSDGAEHRLDRGRGFRNRYVGGI
jgi:hypothetical protein